MSAKITEEDRARTLKELEAEKEHCERLARSIKIAPGEEMVAAIAKLLMSERHEAGVQVLFAVADRSSDALTPTLTWVRQSQEYWAGLRGMAPHLGLPAAAIVDPTPYPTDEPLNALRGGVVAQSGVGSVVGQLGGTNVVPKPGEVRPPTEPVVGRKERWEATVRERHQIPRHRDLLMHFMDGYDRLAVEIREWRFYAWLRHGQEYLSISTNHGIGEVPKDDSGAYDIVAANLKCLDCDIDFAKVSPRQGIFTYDVARAKPELVEVLIKAPTPSPHVTTPEEHATFEAVDRATAAAPARTTTDGKPPRPGFEDAPAPAPVKANGQHEAYWVLSAEERAKGFVRPVRLSYRHVGTPGAKYSLRDLTPEETARYGHGAYAKVEPVPEEPGSSLRARLWTQAQLDSVGRGCGTVTSMSRPIAETYARQPDFYGATYCATCNKHLPVGEQGEFVWESTANGQVERVGT